jgi:glycosyltransferase involved in cell wall biosynthesis
VTHVVFNGWFWDQPNTGSGQYIRRLLPALQKVAPDLQMTLVLPPGLTAAENVPSNVNLVPTSGSRSNLGKVKFEQRTFPAAVARVKGDIAHVPYWGPPLSSPAPLVTSVLDMIPLAIPDYAEGIRARMYTSLVSAAARGSAHVITISEHAKSEIVKYLGIPADNITVTYLASDDAFHPRMGAERDESVKARYNLPDNFVLYLGGFDIRKRVNQLLLAYTYVGPSQGDEYPLVIAGKEPEWGTPMFPDLRKYADDLKISEWVHWIGLVNEEDKPSLYRLATAFVYPSMYEGFGLPVLDALQSGTPTIASEIPVMEEVAGDAAYLVKPGDARTMGGAILALLLQNPLRETQIQRGLAQATRFSWRKTARETVSVYERVMGHEE